MGLGTELEFDKYCKVVESPKTGRRSQRRNSKAEEKDGKGKTTTRTSRLSMGENFTEISFSKSLSSSCKSMQSGPNMVAGNEAPRRGSVYQSSKELRRMKKMEAFEVRENMDLSTSQPFRIIDSLSQSDDAVPLVEKKSSLISHSGNTNPKSITVMEPDTSFCFHSSPASVVTGNVPSDGFFEIRMDSDDREQCSTETSERGPTEQMKFRCDQTMGPLNDGNTLMERDAAIILHKSSSEKLGIPCSLRGLESDHSKASSKTRFSQFRRMLDPFMKSKSQRNPSVSLADVGDVGDARSIRRSRTLCKSLLNEFSNTPYEMDTSAQFVEKGHSLTPASSPAHLHGLLKLEFKHGVPIFEFSLMDSEDFLVAKTWKADSAFNWVYTFHSLNSIRKGSSNSWGAKERQKESVMVGQMQVSSYLCSELGHNGAFDNSMVTEFVLYDLAHARKNLPAYESSKCSTDSTKPIEDISCENLVAGNLVAKSKDSSDLVNNRLESRHSSGNDDADTATSYPWAPADLHPNLEIAAMVIQVPFEKRESLKGKREDKVNEHQNLLDFSAVNQRSNDIPGRSLTNMKVVIPSGTHGLPTTEEGGGPSPLLDRWKSNGRCDCGGWDMACPLLVFDSPSVENMAGHQLMENEWPSKLFVQGAKEKVPALTIEVIHDGKYSVDFHAQLSKLQAFSICVAILHTSEVCTAGQEKENQRLQCNSLKVLLEEEVRFLIEAVAEEEKRKNIISKKMEGNPPSFMLNPPFSPIARV